MTGKKSNSIRHTFIHTHFTEPVHTATVKASVRKRKKITERKSKAETSTVLAHRTAYIICTYCIKMCTYECLWHIYANTRVRMLKSWWKKETEFEFNKNIQKQLHNKNYRQLFWCARCRNSGGYSFLFLFLVGEGEGLSIWMKTG